MDDKSPASYDSRAVHVDSEKANAAIAVTALRIEDLVHEDQLALTSDAHFNHCHPQVPSKHDRRAEKTLICVSILTLVFIAAEFTGGYFANSLAIMTDAGHMLSDLLSFLISLFAIYVARRPATMRLSFGFYRAEILGAVCSIFIIWILTGILVYLAIIRVIREDFDIDANPMLITASVGVVFNIIMGVVLHYGGGGHGHSHFGGGGHSHHEEHNEHDEHDEHHGHSHEHGHGHSHEHGSHDQQQQTCASHELSPARTIAYRRQSSLIAVITSNRANPETPKEADSTEHPRKGNINVRAAFIHVIGDLVQSIGVVIAALIIKFTGWKLADPVCTFLFSILVLITTVAVMRDAVIVLMEGTPRGVQYSAVKNDLQKIKGVQAAHSLHMWSLTTDKAALAVHLAIDATEDALKIMQKANQLMRKKYNVAFTTVQVEPFDARFMTSCEQCIGPVI